MDTNIMVIDAVQDLAIKRIKPKNKREDVLPGQYPVDFLLRIQGEVKVGEDHEYTPTAELPVLGLLSFAMRYCGITRDALAKAITETANQAKESGKSFRDIIEQENVWTVETLRSIREKITYELPKSKRNGQVTGKVIATLIN